MLNKTTAIWATSATILLLLIPYLFVQYTGELQPDSTSLIPPIELLPEQATIIPEEIELVFIGDTGTATQQQYDVADAIKGHCGRLCKATHILGDVIYNSGVESVSDEGFNERFEEPYKEIETPFFISFGNHDYNGCKECYIEYNDISQKWIMPSPYYSVRHSKEVIVFVINTENFDTTQQEWLERELQDSDAKYKIIAGHKPILTYESLHGGENWQGITDLKNIICNSADIYFAGHAHLLELNEISGCSVKQAISGAGGASPRSINDKDGPIFYYEGSGFATIKVDPSGLVLRYFDIDGTELYTETF